MSLWDKLDTGMFIMNPLILKSAPGVLNGKATFVVSE